VWRELNSDLRSTSSLYVVFDKYNASVIRSSDPAILEFIRSRYEVAFVGASGTWYVRRHPGLPSADG
jgi:hypothetical protein